MKGQIPKHIGISMALSWDAGGSRMALGIRGEGRTGIQRSLYWGLYVHS